MRSFIWLTVFAVLYVVVVVPHLGVAYIDFGDGNYLYISRQIADGVTLYRDILAPQPPCHLLLGAALIKVGRLFGQTVEHELYTVRAFSILLHLATMVLVWALGLRLFRRVSIALLAAAIYIVIPIGFWWTLGYQSEPLEMFFLLSALLLLFRWTPWAMAGAGLLATLAISTNMTAVPYVGWAGLVLLVYDRRRALWFIVPVIVSVAVVVGIGELWTGGHYLENVFFNQVGTFPHPDLLQGAPPPGAPLRGIRTVLGYALRKVVSEGSDVLRHDGLFIAAAIAGVLLYLKKGPFNAYPRNRADNSASEAANASARPDDDFDTHSGIREDSFADTQIQNPKSKIQNLERRFVGWYAFWSFMSLGFVAKGATEDYIFTIGEPFVCLFAAYAIVVLVDALIRRNDDRETGETEGLRAPALRTILVVLGFVVLFGHPVLWINAVVRYETAYELKEAGVENLRILIERHSQPGDEILGPPYYAFIAERDLVVDFSELFIWQIKYALETEVEKKPGTATEKVEAIAKALREKTLPIALVNVRGPTQQLLRIEPIRAALEANYEPILETPVRTLNTDIQVFVPKGTQLPE